MGVCERQKEVCRTNKIARTLVLYKLVRYGLRLKHNFGFSQLEICVLLKTNYSIDIKDSFQYLLCTPYKTWENIHENFRPSVRFEVLVYVL